MTKGRTLVEAEEKRSYGALFVLVIAFLLAMAVWAIWQDVFSRHLWKKFKTDFYRIAVTKYEADLAADTEELAAQPDYVALLDELDEVRAGLDSPTGEARKRLDELAKELESAEVTVMETDLELRFIKGKIEEDWYLLEHAQHGGETGAEEHEQLEKHLAEKIDREKEYQEAVDHRDSIEDAIDEVRSREKEILKELRDYHKTRDSIHQRLDSVSMEFFGSRSVRIPTIDQVELVGFERNNFEQWISRVDRCTNCHAGINKPGFEDEPNPYKTHPNRSYYLANHEKLGCTPCHGGQGPSINDVDLAHGFVKFWEDPLLDVTDKVQAKCLTCHASAQNLEGAEIAGRGEELFREMGCHGCHLMEGFEHLEKAGPSLKRIAAKVNPEWLVSWVENPQEFRPRTRMPNFVLDREEAELMSAYLLASAVDDSASWREGNPDPVGVAPDNAGLVERGEELTRTLGCLGCHGFEDDEYADQVAIGKDVAPNLSRIAEKTDAQWIYGWIVNPRSYSEHARMPSLRLTAEEASAITSYLLTLRKEPTMEPDAELRAKLAEPESIEAGAKLIRKYGCFGCHVINGMEGESRVSVELSTFGSKHLDELFFGDRLDIPRTWDDWTINKVLNPRTYETERIEQNMPVFGFDEGDARAIVVYLASRLESKINPKYFPSRADREVVVLRGRELVSHYNCTGCHSFDGREGSIRKFYEDDIDNAPPVLYGEGLKVQPDWLFNFLKKPVRLRPWLQVRMPTFGLNDGEVSALVDYFAAVEGYDLGVVVVEGEEGERGPAAGRTATMDAGTADCMACHPRGPGRPHEDSYHVSRTPLTDAQIGAWLAEHLGVENGGSMTTEERSKAVRELLTGAHGGS